ncbi:DUF523 domain-containing protein [Paenibacillus sp. FSL M7-1455]|jgi:uncharacterized protein YbbK (DUF523 family)|uniref:DUF523 domain-containing protein n=1 Tax=Paenibacillus cookii TaxID=157839 RepID=A0ABQ4LTY5_9BACL|nr:DUF523 domain-containing protein [Paenibacillus cookii]KHF36029.1 hypothetical protein CM49_01654 [Paenibacillus sp. P1XP2]GIO66735.1 hypothetical protein J21TS3_15560 [Paenibacillus cookii]HWO52959.1 DUF523 domain-containing protein [Paenibacillus cookii]
MIVVSSCLAGLKVRYNGTDCLDETIRRLVGEKKAVTVCPELMGGFATPREPAEIQGGTGADVLDGQARVIEKSGRDVSEMYVKGAYAALEVIRGLGARLVVLKEYSPSCGSLMIYDGKFENRKVAGSGVTAALLQREGIEVISEEQFLERLRLRGE